MPRAPRGRAVGRPKGWIAHGANSRQRSRKKTLFCARDGETVRTVVAEGNAVLLARVRVDVHELESVAVDLTPHERHLEQVDVGGFLPAGGAYCCIPFGPCRFFQLFEPPQPV